MKHPFITVIGNVGSGKSTFSMWLAGKLSGKFVAADELYKTNPFFNDAVVGRSRWSFTSDVWFLLQRVQMVRELKISLAQSAVVQDSGLPMSWVYANSRLSQGYMNTAEAALYAELFQNMTEKIVQEDLLIYLDIPVSTVLTRIKQRGREFEIKHHSAEYLHGLQDSLETYVKKQREAGKKVLQFSQAETDNFLEDTHSQQRIFSRIGTALH